MKQKKTIIFCAPADYGFSNSIKKALQISNFEVYDFPIVNVPFKYKNIFQRIYNAYRKVCLGDYCYKKNMQIELRNKHLLQKLHNTPNTDYALIIRPDLYTEEFVKKTKNKSKILSGYQWDGLIRFPDIYKYLPLFDRFFVFDEEDLHKNKNLLPLTNFYIPKKFQKIENSSVYLIATFDEYRFNLIKRLNEIFIKLNNDVNFMIISNQKSHLTILKDAKFKIVQPLDYEQNILQVENSCTLIDIHVPIHSGLSFRIFEALYYEKKLITTNKSVINYDFYHPNNIFIWDLENEKDIESFLSSKYIPVNPKIRNKYSFQNWIKYVLDIENHTPIELPTLESQTIKFFNFAH